MNDSLTAQLTSDYTIPAYAQNRLWLDSETGSAKCEGGKGLFELEAAAPILTLRWNGEHGVPLTQLAWQVDNLGWDGSIRLGGIVEALHLTHLPDIDYPLAIIFFSAQPLKPHIRPFPDASLRNLAHFPDASYIDGVDDSGEAWTVPFITFADSPLVPIAQESLSQHNPLHVFGSLANEEDSWHDYFALPLVWESVTVFAP
jgi:hypothetical protein